jgi:hypothetical protein
MPDEALSPSITTGIEALGRGHDLDKLDMFVKGMADIVPPDLLGKYVNFPDYMTRRATALGIKTDGLINTQEQVQQEQMAQQQAQQQAMMQQQMAQSGGKVAEKMAPQGPTMEAPPNE